MAISNAASRCAAGGSAVQPPKSRFRAVQARNLLMDLDDAGCRVKYLIRDRDGKYPALFHAILADAGITVVLSGVRIPRMNSIVERSIQSCRQELLDQTLIWNQTHLLHTLREYERHHDRHRPHRGIATAAAATRTDDRSRHDHTPTHPPTRSPRRAPPRIRSSSVSCTDDVLGIRTVSSRKVSSPVSLSLTTA